MDTKVVFSTSDVITDGNSDGNSEQEGTEPKYDAACFPDEPLPWRAQLDPLLLLLELLFPPSTVDDDDDMS